MNYWQLRVALLRHPIDALFQALNQGGLLLIALLGTALPAAVYLVLLNFGLLMDETVDPLRRLPILLHLLVLQILWMGLLRDAIVGNQAKLLLRSVPGHRHHRRVSLLLASLVNPLLWPPLLILLSSAPAHWQALLPQWLMLILLLMLQWSSLFTPAGTLVFFGGVFGLSLVMMSETCAAFLLSAKGMALFMLMLVICQRLPSKHLQNRILAILANLPLPAVTTLGQACLREHLPGLILRVTLAGLVIATGHLATSQLAGLVDVVHTLTVSLLAAIAASWQFPLSRFLDQHRTLLASLPRPLLPRLSLLAQPLLLGLLMFQFWQCHASICLLQLLLFVGQILLIQYQVRRAGQHFAIAALLTAIAAQCLHRFFMP
ncbi:hypothetical protein KJI95_05200 [Shewanella sp. JM162201]|uniref:Uncharacterized protein n=1 Tax=Shewanella jiangmenensis TaxID=2837387 RepID=A0ABS5V0D7_9GAMM|nr:DUF6136 family protein [Shewanella jiangmenensis]MBT1443920.1 hypothetical protein [Shewanella jiangmenensis]